MPISYEVFLGFLVQLLVYAFVQGRVFQRQKDMAVQLDKLEHRLEQLPCNDFCKMADMMAKKGG